MVDAADLELWAQLADEGLPLAAGGEVRSRWIGSPDVLLPAGATCRLVGPPGWLGDHQPGETVGFRLRDGRLALEPTDPSDGMGLSQEQLTASLTSIMKVAAAAAAEALRDHLDDEDDCPIPGAHLAQVVAAIRRLSPEAFRAALPPLEPLLIAFGLEVWRGYVGVHGAPWAGELPGLDDADRLAMRAWVTMLAQHRADSSGRRNTST